MTETGGTNSLAYLSAGSSDALSIVDVDAVTLDEFCALNEVPHINLIKTDTEGHDICVLRGASEMLQAGRIDVYQFEYNHLWVHSNAFLRNVFQLVQNTPYRVARLLPGRVELVDEWHPELDRFFAGNYLLLHPRALHWFDARPVSFDASNTFAAG